MADHNSFLYIPDITGFTEFVNNTEITHGQHIISELLESIINANELDLIVSEVEGDAVLFYKQNGVPTFDELVIQSEKIFIDFHERIKRLESHRICECGACRSAIDLSIKMVAHIGPIGFTEVNKVRKPYGAEVVTIHRLLKNDVPNKEYVLLSDAIGKHYASDLPKSTFPWLNPQNLASGKDTLITYFGLESLFDRVKEPEPPKPPTRLANPFTLSVYIDRDKQDVLDLLLNFDLRKLWNKDAKEILYDKSKINQVGTRHQCVLDNNSIIEFESFTGDFGKDVLVYGERILHFKVVKSASIFYIMAQEDGRTRLKLELHIEPIPIIGKLLKALMILKMKKEMQKQLEYIKAAVEKESVSLSQIA